MGLIVDGRSKAKESSDSKKHDRKHKYESEFWLVDSVIPPRKDQADVIVQWSSDNLSNESQDKWGDADEANLRHCEVVWRKREDRGVDNAEYDDPRQGRSIYEKCP